MNLNDLVMPLFAGIAAVAALNLSSRANIDVVLMGFAVMLAIIGRIAQARQQHDELMKALGRGSRQAEK